MVNNPTFQAGECYTTFIEETPELFDLTQRTDRASKILDFLGDKIVNVSKGEKPYFEDRVLPKYDETALVYGAKDEFKKLGAKGFTQKILGEKRLYVTDTSMRDAQQSLIATRMRTRISWAPPRPPTSSSRTPSPWKPGAALPMTPPTAS